MYQDKSSNLPFALFCATRAMASRAVPKDPYHFVILSPTVEINKSGLLTHKQGPPLWPSKFVIPKSALLILILSSIHSSNIY